MGSSSPVGATRSSSSNPFPCLFVDVWDDVWEFFCWDTLHWNASLRSVSICCPDEYCVNTFYSQDGFVSVGRSSVGPPVQVPSHNSSPHRPSTVNVRVDVFQNVQLNFSKLLHAGWYSSKASSKPNTETRWVLIDSGNIIKALLHLQDVSKAPFSSAIPLEWRVLRRHIIATHQTTAVCHVMKNGMTDVTDRISVQCTIVVLITFPQQKRALLSSKNYEVSGGWWEMPTSSHLHVPKTYTV